MADATVDACSAEETDTSLNPLHDLSYTNFPTVPEGIPRSAGMTNVRLSLLLIFEYCWVNLELLATRQEPIAKVSVLLLNLTGRVGTQAHPDLFEGIIFSCL